MAKISVRCDEDLHKRIVKSLPWGCQAQAIRIVVQLLVEEIEKRGHIVIAELIHGRYKVLGERGKLE